MGGPGSGRKPKPKQERPDTVCKNCGQVIPAGRNGNRETCNNACKQAYYRKKKEAEAGAGQPAL